MSKVCIINESRAYIDMFESQGWEVVRTIDEADLVQFTGGADVSPSYYGEFKHPQTHINNVRDKEELDLFKYCVSKGKRMAGICRGGQFLHVVSGGSLWQHVQHHAIHGTHGAYDVRTNQFLPVTSTHHQMMRESDNGLTVLVGDGVEPARKEHMIANGDIESVKCDVDVEAVYHEETKCFCFQPHPEFNEGQCRAYYFGKLNELFGLE